MECEDMHGIMIGHKRISNSMEVALELSLTALRALLAALHSSHRAWAETTVYEKDFAPIFHDFGEKKKYETQRRQAEERDDASSCSSSRCHRRKEEHRQVAYAVRDRIALWML